MTPFARRTHLALCAVVGLGLGGMGCGASDGPPGSPPPTERQAPLTPAPSPARPSPSPAPTPPIPAPAPEAPFESLREVWPDRFCAVPTSGVPSAVRVETCNCGERVACRVRQVPGGVDLEVRDDPSTMVACTACQLGSARCPILRSLAPGHDTLRVNGRVPVRVETSGIGLLEPGRCWDVPAP